MVYNNNVGVVGSNGWVGKSMIKLFPDAIAYDLESPDMGGINFTKNIEDLAQCEYAFICVPTPPKENGQCDTSIVEDSIKKLNNLNGDSVITIRSTIELMTTEKLVEKYNHKIAFQPEYLGETQQHPFLDPRTRPFVILGGEKDTTRKVADLYKTVYNADVAYYFTDSRTAELCKYMENSFLGTKVIFCNEFYDIAESIDVDYNELRELWLADYRIGRSHSDVYPDKRGFSGKCLPKDISALIYSAEKAKAEPALMKKIVEINENLKKSLDNLVS
jgi:UDPglucose 6-dehydrogenase